MNGACLVQQCQTMRVNGVANRAPVSGAASSFPAPSPLGVWGFAPLLQTGQTPKPDPTGGQSQWELGFRRGRQSLAVPTRGRAAPPCPLPRHLLCAVQNGARNKSEAEIGAQVLLLRLGEGRSTSDAPGRAAGLRFGPFLKVRAALMRCGVHTWLYFSFS